MLLTALSILQSVNPGDEAAAGVAILGLVALVLVLLLVLLGWHR